MTIHEILMGVLPGSLTENDNNANASVQVEIYGRWKGSLEQLVNLRIPISSVLYDKENGFKIFLEE